VARLSGISQPRFFLNSIGYSLVLSPPQTFACRKSHPYYVCTAAKVSQPSILTPHETVRRLGGPSPQSGRRPFRSAPPDDRKWPRTCRHLLSPSAVRRSGRGFPPAE